MNDESRPKAAHEIPGAASTDSISQHTDGPPEPSAWLRGAAARRLRQIVATVGDTTAYGLVVAPLGRSGPPGSHEDRSCDRCRRYVEQGDQLNLFHYLAAPRVVLTSGLCGPCWAKEGPR